MSLQSADAPAVAADGASRRDTAQLFVAILLGAALLLLPLFGYGPFRACRAAVPATTAAEARGATPSAPALSNAAPQPAAIPTPPPAAESAPAPAPEQTAQPAPVAPIETPPTARVYFETGRAALPGAVVDNLAPVVAYLKANPGARAAVSGFHDPRGSAVRNARLAERRARAVAAYLVDQGIAAERLDLKKPASTLGDGPQAEARRVEVTILQ